MVIPAHNGAPCIARSTGLGDELGFVPTDEHTLQSTVAPEIFALGDAASLPISKAGSVTHFEGEVLVENVQRFLAGRAARRLLRRARQLLHRDRIPQGDAHRLQLRRGAAARPLPRPRSGLPLMKDSRLNHLGKLMFQWIYWHSLLPGRDLPGLHSAMPTAGKQPAVDA